MTRSDPSDASLSTLVGGLVAFLDEQRNRPKTVPARAVPDALTRAFGTCAQHLVILMLVARSDGKVAAEERDVIVRYCAERARRQGTQFDAEEKQALDDYLRGFHPTLTEITSAVEGLRHATIADIAGLISAARAVVEADGVVRLPEAMYLGSLERELIAIEETNAVGPESGEAKMEMDVAMLDNVARIKLKGRLDTHGVDEVETKFTASVVPGRHNAVVDLSGLDFITSMGLRMFISVAKALKRHGVKMVLFAPQPQVNEVFTSASLSQIVPIVTTEAEALSKLKA
jgi:anti-anti-sigma factor